MKSVAKMEDFKILLAILLGCGPLGISYSVMAITTSTRLPGDSSRIGRLDLSHSGHVECPVPVITGMEA